MSTPGLEDQRALPEHVRHEWAAGIAVATAHRWLERLAEALEVRDRNIQRLAEAMLVVERVLSDRLRANHEEDAAVDSNPHPKG